MLALCGIKWKNAVYGDEGAEYITKEKQMRKIMSAGVLAMEQLPLLQIDGLHLVQQNAIMRYLARRHGLYGSSAAEAAQCDILSDSMTDWGPVSAVVQGKDPGHVKYLARFQRALASNETGSFLVGSGPTFVDVQLFQALTQLAASKTVDIKSKFPELETYRKKVAALPGISAYLNSDTQLPFPGMGGKEAFFANVAAVIPWVFGKADQPPLLASSWRFQK